MRSLLVINNCNCGGARHRDCHSADAADAAQGEHAFAKCAVCHAKDRSNGIGPGLLGVIGRHAGSVIQRRKVDQGL